MPSSKSEANNTAAQEPAANQAPAPLGGPDDVQPKNAPPIADIPELDGNGIDAASKLQDELTPVGAAFQAITDKPKDFEVLNKSLEGLNINQLGVLRAQMDTDEIRLVYAAKADDNTWQRAMRTIASRLARELDERHGKRFNAGPLYVGQSALGTIGGEIGVGTEDGRRTAIGFYARAEHLFGTYKPVAKSAMSQDLARFRKELANKS